MSMQNGTRILFPCDKTIRTSKEAKHINLRMMKRREAYRELQINVECERVHLTSIVNNFRIHEFTKSCKLMTNSKELLKFRQRNLTAETRTSKSDFGFQTIDAVFRTRNFLHLVLI